MNRRHPMIPWASIAWVPVAIACSDSTASLPPIVADCQGSKDATCSAPASFGGAGSPGGQNSEDSGTTGTIVTTTGSCGTAGSMVGASAQACEPCIETGTGSLTGSGCCSADLACSTNSACTAILSCAVLCGASNGACITNCVNNSPSGATDFNDFVQCVEQNCSSCPALMPTVASDL